MGQSQITPNLLPQQYPYTNKPLQPAWASPKAWGFAGLTTVVLTVTLLLRAPIELAQLDDVVLRNLFPAFLAIVLAFAPRPTNLLGQIAKDLTVISIVLSIFSGDTVVLMVGAFPIVLALAVLLSRSRHAKYIWRTVLA